MVRSITTGEPCRCCLAERENLQHFAHCPKLILLWKQLHAMTETPALKGGTDWERFCLFALHPTQKLTLGWINLHLLLWKHITALLVKIELEGEKYAEEKIWAPAWIRFERKVLALKEKVDMARRRAEGRGEKPRDMSGKTKHVEPLASFTEHGELKWNEQLVKAIKEKGKLNSGQT